VADAATEPALLSSSERAALRAELIVERGRAEHRLVSLRRSVDELVDAADLEPPDDEHDPDGTTAYERAQFRLRRNDPYHQVNELTGGAFAPGSITFAIEPGSGSTTVSATVRSQTRGTTLLAPILRRVLGRALAKGLQEDRLDLESGRYQAATPETTASPAG